MQPPNKPQDLLEYRLLAFSFWTPSDAWNFVHANGKKKETLTLQPFLAMNDYALYILPPGVPPPSPELDKLLKCLDGKVGPVTVTATTNGRHADKGHALGSSVDILPSKGLPADNVFCAAGACGAVRGLNEAPAQGGQKLPTTTGGQLSFIPRSARQASNDADRDTGQA